MMSSTVENYHYIVYNEFDKPVQYTEPPPNLFAYKNTPQNTPQELEPAAIIDSITRDGESGQVQENGTVQTNLTELAELITSATNKQGREGNVNVYNKCVFFVNSYSNGDIQDATKILGQLSQPSSSTRPHSSNSFEIPDDLAEKVSSGLGGSNYSPKKYLNEFVDKLDHKSVASPVCSAINSFNDDPIVVSSDSEDEPIVESVKTNQTLFFVDKNDLKPILTPNVMPGVYKKVSQVDETSSRSTKSNVYTNAKKNCGKIMTTKDFEASFAAEDDINIKTENISESVCAEETPTECNSVPELVPKKVTDKIKSVYDGGNDKLWHLAYDILKLPLQSDSVRFNRANNELVYSNPSNKKKIIYKILQPADLQLSTISMDQNIKLGNPTFIQCLDLNAPKEPPQVSLPPVNGIPKRPRGRPRKTARKRANTMNEQIFIQNTPSTNSFIPQDIIPQPVTTSSPTSRTRFGRISKLPPFIESNFKVSTEPSHQILSFDTMNDIDYRCNTEVNTQPATIENDELTRSKRERNVPPEYRCSGCNKIYLGKNKMLRHFGAFPDHFSNTDVEEMVRETSLYTFLVKKVQQENQTEDQRIKLLLNELTDLVNQLQARRSQLITHQSAIYFVNSVASKVLGTTEGHYGIKMDALNAPPAPISEPTILEPPPVRLDYNLSISLDDTLADAKLNLSENMITSDDSLLRTVDDLVKEGIRNLTGDVGLSRDPVPSVINYDHASDNAVEAASMKETQAPPILDLSLDLFQFNSN